MSIPEAVIYPFQHMLALLCLPAHSASPHFDTSVGDFVKAFSQAQVFENLGVVLYNRACMQFFPRRIIFYGL
jgi:hypothetical protein